MTTQWLTRNFIAIGIFTIFAPFGYLYGSSFFTSEAVLFIGWLMIPYVVWTFINELRPDSFSKRLRVYFGFAIAVPVIEVGAVVYVWFFPDPQAGFAFFYVPFIQLLCLFAAREICKK
ncbi:MAG: hypothetical protein HOP01_07315 [Gallionella sp.]|nr:hypothetical protein [Gallionella sp.]